MSKTASIVIVSILSVLIIFLGVFSFVTDIPVGDYKIYYSPASLVQLGSGFTSTEEASYTIDIEDFDDEELADLSSSLTSTLNSRLGAVYGYYNSDISVSDDMDRLYISIPTTSAHDETSADTILSNVVSVGLVEFCSIDEDTYSSTGVLMSLTDDDTWFKSASVSEYISGENTYYIVTVKLTTAGLEEANDVLDHSGSTASGYVAVDGTYSYYVYHTEATKEVTIYTGSLSDANVLASYFNYGSLDTSVTLINSVEVEGSCCALTIVAGCFGALIIALCAVLLIKFGSFAVGTIMTLVTTGIGCVILSGLGYFSLFSYAAVAGFVLGLALFAFCLWTITQCQYDERSKSNYLVLGFKSAWKKILIVCGATLVVGIILWVIPCAVTVSLGNALVYSAVLSAFGSIALHWLFVFVTKSLVNN